MTTVDNPSSYRRSASAARVADLDESQFEAFLHFPKPNARGRIAVAAFWAAVAVLIGARVVLFDPSAARAVGSFPSQIAPVLHIR